jgi:hypothetical protein
VKVFVQAIKDIQDGIYFFVVLHSYSPFMAVPWSSEDAEPSPENCFSSVGEFTLENFHEERFHYIYSIPTPLSNSIPNHAFHSNSFIRLHSKPFIQI